MHQLEAPARATGGPLIASRTRRTVNWLFLARWFGPELAVTTLAGLVFFWRVGSAGAWRDEAATMVIADRTLPQILSLARSIDLVHLVYYLGAHELLQLHRTPLLSQALPGVRLISVVAAALTAAVIVRIGRQLDSVGVGVTAALIFTLAPMSSRYAQEARPYALVILASTFATYALLRACRRPWLRRRWVLYAAAIVTTGLLNVLSVFLLAVHLVYLGWQTPWAVRRRWATAAAGALTLLSPFALATFRQRGQIDWLYATDLGNLRDFFRTEYQTLTLPLVIIALGFAAPWLAKLSPRLADLQEAHRAALVLGVIWTLLPPISMWLISRVMPIFDWRYAVFTLPESALMLASLARVARPLGAVVPVVAVLVAGWPMQLTYRDPTIGHSEDIRGASAYVARYARAGDGVLFIPSHMRLVAQLYPERFTGLDDLALAEDPITSSTISGVERRAGDVEAALAKHRRVWVVAGPFGMAETWTDTDRAKVENLLRSYRIIQQRTVLKFTVFLYIAAGGDPDLPAPPPSLLPAHPY